MKNFITFNDLNKELYLYDTHCHHKDDHIWVIEAVDLLVMRIMVVLGKVNEIKNRT